MENYFHRREHRQGVLAPIPADYGPGGAVEHPRRHGRSHDLRDPGGPQGIGRRGRFREGGGEPSGSANLPAPFPFQSPGSGVLSLPYTLEAISSPCLRRREHSGRLAHLRGKPRRWAGKGVLGSLFELGVSFGPISRRGTKPPIIPRPYPFASVPCPRRGNRPHVDGSRAAA